MHMEFNIIEFLFLWILIIALVFLKMAGKIYMYVFIIQGRIVPANMRLIWDLRSV